MLIDPKEKYGRLTPVREAGRGPRRQVLWLFQCDCGNETVKPAADVHYGRTSSCGCLRSECARNRVFKHGQFGTRIHAVWRGMKSRCMNPNHVSYHNYGGRGIKVCAEWAADASSFIAWAKSTGYEKGLTLDRVDVDGDYEPGNCRWATRQEQARNKRAAGPKASDGRLWSEIAVGNGIKYTTYKRRIQRGYSPEVSATTPVGGLNA